MTAPTAMRRTAVAGANIAGSEATEEPNSTA